MLTPGHKILQSLEKSLKYPVAAYYSTASPLSEWEAESIAEALEVIGGGPRLGFIIQSLGGDPNAARLMIKLLREYYEEIDVFVPSHAYSAGTLFALGSDRIWMGPTSRLGPIDPQVRMDERLIIPEDKSDTQNRSDTFVSTQIIHDFLEWSGVIEGERSLDYSVDLDKLATLIGPLNPWNIGWYERVKKEVRVHALGLLSEYLLKNDPDPEQKAEAIVNALMESFISHNTSILRTEARQIGLPVLDCKAAVWKKLSDLTDFYNRMILASDGVVAILESSNGAGNVKFNKPVFPCPNCADPLIFSSGHKFCSSCGHEIQKECKKCAKPQKDHWKHCAYCGNQN
jgi:hypothetical protein